LRLLTRLEVKVPGAGLNLTRAMLDAATKYPWTKGDGPKYGVYDDDVPVFDWLRRGAPEGRRCLETQVMDWADDVAYSVHDLEDGIVAGLIDPDALWHSWQEVAPTAQRYTDAGLREIEEVFGALLSEPWWPRDYDGSTGAQVVLKNATSTLIGGFCRDAETATRRAFGDGALSRYDADLVVPPEARVRCAVLKGITAHYVMSRPGVTAVQERERQVVSELVARLADLAPGPLEPMYAEAWQAAPDDSARLRVVVDQVAGLTDAAAAALHQQLV
jgi:dGTPase